MMHEIKMNYKSAWLTLNRVCNLQCPWCYASQTKHDSSSNMEKELSLDLIDFIDKLNIKYIILIGGEPTLYPHLLDVIKAIKNKNIKSTLVTNAIKLQDESFCKKIYNNGLNEAAISIKGTEKIYSELSKNNEYAHCIEAISNLSKYQDKVTVSFVMTQDNMRDLPKLIRATKKAGATHFSLSFVYEFNCSGTPNTSFKSSYSPRNMIKSFMQFYNEINDVTDGNFSLHNAFPLCLWDKDDYNKLKSNNQIRTVCQLLSRTGIIFDTEGTIIPCNTMHQIRLLKYGQDFTTPEELYSGLKNEEVQAIYRKLLGAPDHSCSACQNWKDCGGGCVTTYTNYSLNEMLEKDKKNTT